MAGSNEETVEVGMNKERRLCGLAGDDDEDNMDEDREALFGAATNFPVPLAPQRLRNQLQLTVTTPSAHAP